ncbi:hypothetical protein HCN44_006971 [Aphidius gifuensis]|uniref:PEHE domain-containing protein n=1 Tax=Aphidius gifuensis TaxID=684658 RepID=A0A835CTD4_APHGI|nr:KAT8 regulatory NSL complex subunit 1 [Aphidius gifuensis]XP_044004206.1 KAT8 regulatory NSL complex subunit 1 [Aphidius gifuensis]XP_044004207.1 KAT8 regulatory NSL complex subunit 1 [Aphidius gifuensis]XP_044004208.1 KAT8 regulatory NSL complex subunit 1 [Aphidius gifuensis]KAF7995864.1 hypothetical protein HCN44_006971 [Aphidius gifuensis]
MGVSTAPEQHRRGFTCRWEPLDVEAVAPATSVAVMAPALTESGPQKPDNLLSPLPSSGFLTKEQAAQVCHNREVLAKFVVSANVQPTKIDEHCLRGISKDLIRDVINSKYVNGLDSLSKLANDSDLIASKLTEVETGNLEDEEESGDIEDDYAKQQLQQQTQHQQQLDKQEEEDNNIVKLEKENIINNQIYINNNSTNNQQQQQELENNINNLKHSLFLTDCNIIDESDAIMSEPSACDNNDEMGFIKTNDDVIPMIPIIGNDDLSDNKNLIDDVKNIMELTNDLSTNVVGDITSNVDDILQVFKSMEENVDNNIVDTNNVNDITNDTTNIFSINEGFTSFDERVFNDVDDNIDIGDVIDQQQQHEHEQHQQQQQQQYEQQQQQQQHLHLQQLQQLQLELQLSDENLRIQQLQVDEQQYNNERKCEFLLRRLRKIQAKIIGRHVAEECHGVLEISHNSVKNYLLQEIANISGSNITQTAIKLPDIGGNINTFLQKIEKSCLAQSNSVSRQRPSYRYFGAGSRDNITSGNNTNNNRHQVFGAAQVKIDGDEVENIAGSLAMQLHTVETKIDSDCTASSSGGESCDEMETYNNLQQQQLPITKRAAWKYAQDRAGIAARWTWLQAQITDLEFRIRHHNEFQRQIRSTKGHVVLKNVESINGYSGSLPGSTPTPSPSSSSTTTTLNEDDTSTASSSSSCCRTRPFVWELYKKRKLIRVDGLHEYSKRAAKPSNIRCNCDHVLPSCALCTGRIDPTQPQESHEQLSLADKIALVDTSYHPVLSFTDEISHCTHFNSIMKSSDWQQRTLRGSNNNNSNRLSRNNKDKDTIDNNNRRSNKIKLSDGRSNKYTTLSSTSTLTPTTPTALATTTTTLLTTPISTATTTTPSSLALTSSSSRIKKSSLLTARITRKDKGKKDSSTRRNIIGKRKIKTHLNDYYDDDASIYSSSSKHSSPVSSPLPIMNSVTIPLTHITSTAITTITTQSTTTTTPITTNTDRHTKEKTTNSHKRLRRGSYDIDNIVIPYSVAASAKPEKLQYKEILTPKWRLCGDMIKQDLKNGILHRPSQDSDSEDVSEETIALRHERSEREENKRFMNYINRLPQGRLRHPRRADSRADSGANTPDPMSPQTGDFGGDVTSPPATPSCIQETEQNNIIDVHKNSSLQYAVRRRTYSSSMRIRDENINSIADDEHEVLPYDPRLFPLTEDIYDKMLQVMPDGHWQTSDETLCLPEEEKPDDEAEIDSHESDTTESAYFDAEGDAEDPNDPEWTVGDDRDAEKERIRPTAKR